MKKKRMRIKYIRYKDSSVTHCRNDFVIPVMKLEDIEVPELNEEIVAIELHECLLCGRLNARGNICEDCL